MTMTNTTTPAPMTADQRHEASRAVAVLVATLRGVLLTLQSSGAGLRDREAAQRLVDMVEALAAVGERYEATVQALERERQAAWDERARMEQALVEAERGREAALARTDRQTDLLLDLALSSIAKAEAALADVQKQLVARPALPPEGPEEPPAFVETVPVGAFKDAST